MTAETVPAPGIRIPGTNSRELWRIASILCSSGAIAIALVNLLGWIIGSRGMTSWIEGITPMKVTGSLLVLAIAVPVLRISRNRSIRRLDRWTLRTAALASFAGGLLAIAFTMVDHLRAGSILLPREVALAIVESPFRVPVASGVSFVLLAVSLWLMPRDWVAGTQWSGGFAFTAAASSMLTLFGYLYRVPSFSGESIYVPMPLAVAVAILLLAFAINTSHPRRHLLGIVFSKGPGGTIARQLLPAVILLPLILGSLHLLMESNNLIGPQLESAVQSTLLLFLLTAVVLHHSLGLDREARALARLRTERDEEVESRLLLWEISDDLLCTAGPDGYLKRVNPAWSRTLGWSEQDFLLRPFIELVHPEDRESTLAELEMLACGNRTSNFTNRYRRSDGSYRTFQWNAAPRGEKNEIIAIARDITDMVATRERILNINRELEARVRVRTQELEAANTELESFSYAVSHDLRAPLRAIEGFSKIVVDRYAKELPEQGQHFLARVRAGAHKMEELIDGIHSLSRLNRGAMRIDQIDLSEMARDVVSDLRAAEPDRRVEIIIEEGMTARGDRRLMRSLMINLIGNAWKFTSKTPDARIHVGRSSGTEGEFFVKDNGAGFDPKHVDKLFSPFQRLHAADQFDGTGLGLATVRRIVNKHGGTVRAAGDPGHGATFTFTLPENPGGGTTDHAN